LKMDYADFCGIDSQATWQEAASLLQTKERSILIDVRAESELPQMDSIEYIRIESDQIEERKNELSSYQNVLLFCQTGIRSLKAAKILQKQFPDKNIQSIEGGILKYYGDLK
jgi:rhodanese-related sulfurtransferase